MRANKLPKKGKNEKKQTKDLPTGSKSILSYFTTKPVPGTPNIPKIQNTSVETSMPTTPVKEEKKPEKRRQDKSPIVTPEKGLLDNKDNFSGEVTNSMREKKKSKNKGGSQANSPTKATNDGSPLKKSNDGSNIYHPKKEWRPKSSPTKELNSPYKPIANTQENNNNNISEVSVSKIDSTITHNNLPSTSTTNTGTSTLNKFQVGQKVKVTHYSSYLPGMEGRETEGKIIAIKKYNNEVVLQVNHEYEVEKFTLEKLANWNPGYDYNHNSYTPSATMNLEINSYISSAIKKPESKSSENIKQVIPNKNSLDEILEDFKNIEGAKSDEKSTSLHDLEHTNIMEELNTNIDSFATSSLINDYPTLVDLKLKIEEFQPLLPIGEYPKESIDTIQSKMMEDIKKGDLAKKTTNAKTSIGRVWNNLQNHRDIFLKTNNPKINTLYKKALACAYYYYLYKNLSSTIAFKDIRTIYILRIIENLNEEILKYQPNSRLGPANFIFESTKAKSVSFDNTEYKVGTYYRHKIGYNQAELHGQPSKDTLGASDFLNNKHDIEAKEKKFLNGHIVAHHIGGRVKIISIIQLLLQETLMVLHLCANLKC